MDCILESGPSQPMVTTHQAANMEQGGALCKVELCEISQVWECIILGFKFFIASLDHEGSLFFFFLTGFYFSFFNYFNSRMITLQHCGGFCSTST